jgi:imidazolonepropionase-like amidohydrolase
MRKALFSLLWLASCAGPAPLPAPPRAPSASVPAPRGDATLHYDIVFGDRVAGHIRLVRHADGSFDEDFAFDDRGNGPETHARLELGPDRLPNRLELTGKDYKKRAVHELVVCDAARCRWEGKDERGEGPRGFYLPANKSVVASSTLLALALEPNGARLLPGGTLRARRIADTTVKAGAASMHVSAYELSGYGFEPMVEWFDDQGALFAQVDDYGAGIRSGWKDAIPALLALQRPFAQARRERLAKEVSRRLPVLSIVHARLFDPVKKRVVDDATIVIEGGKVKAVGAKLPPAKEGEVIDARGMTALPGLWDMHVHVRDEEGLMHLANGITTVRDLGSEVEAAVARRARWEAGTELGPRLLLAGFVDGRGPKEAPFKVFADTEEQANGVVDDYAAKGYLQMKIYSSMKPPLVPVIVRRARAKGMRVSGHVPARMTATDVVRAGYDEIQHIEHVMLDLISQSPDDPRGAVRMAENAAGVDLDGPKTRALLDLLAQRRIVIDPTLNVVEGEVVTRRDRPNPTVAPLLARLPAQVQRRAVRGAIPVAEGMEATYEASLLRCKQLVKRLWERKIPIVAGTDAWAGFALHRELELYAEAGIPNADVLAIATLGAATVMKLDRASGSIAPGKDADLILIDGDPLARMRDVRNVVTVVKGETVIDAVAAQRALSIAPR